MFIHKKSIKVSCFSNCATMEPNFPMWIYTLLFYYQYKNIAFIKSKDKIFNKTKILINSKKIVQNCISPLKGVF